MVTVGGNVGDSARKRRYPRTAQGLLVVERQQMYTQENDAGTLPDLPSQTQAALAAGTARIFALLSVVEECAAVPGQPYSGGVLSRRETTVATSYHRTGLRRQPFDGVVPPSGRRATGSSPNLIGSPVGRSAAPAS